MKTRRYEPKNCPRWSGGCKYLEVNSNGNQYLIYEDGRKESYNCPYEQETIDSLVRNGHWREVTKAAKTRKPKVETKYVTMTNENDFLHNRWIITIENGKASLSYAPYEKVKDYPIVTVDNMIKGGSWKYITKEEVEKMMDLPRYFVKSGNSWISTLYIKASKDKSERFYKDGTSAMGFGLNECLELCEDGYFNEVTEDEALALRTKTYQVRISKRIAVDAANEEEALNKVQKANAGFEVEIA